MFLTELRNFTSLGLSPVPDAAAICSSFADAFFLPPIARPEKIVVREPDFPSARDAIGLDGDHVGVEELFASLARTRNDVASDGRGTRKPSVEAGADVIANRVVVKLPRFALTTSTKSSVEVRDPAPIDVKVASELESNVFVMLFARSAGTDMWEGRKC